MKRKADGIIFVDYVMKVFTIKEMMIKIDKTYLMGVIFTYLGLWWMVKENNIKRHMYYMMFAFAWIITIPMLIVLTIIMYALIIWIERNL